jgi:hypothetical protein
MVVGRAGAYPQRPVRSPRPCGGGRLASQLEAVEVVVELLMMMIGEGQGPRQS